MQQYRLLQASVKVFKVLAWVSLVVQTVTGLILIVRGGEPVTIGDFDVPVRLVGLLNFVAAGVYFYSLWLVSHVLRLLLDIRQRLETSRPS